MQFSGMGTAVLALAMALLAAPGALAAPFVPPSDSHIVPTPSPPKTVTARGEPVSSFRAPVKHRLYEEGAAAAANLTARASSKDNVGFSTYWFASAIAGGQAVELLIDTGSADLWVLGSDVATDQQQGQQIYDPVHSGTAKQLDGARFDIGYGTGGNGVTGPVFADTFAVGGASVPNMAIGSAKSLSGLPGGIFKSGIMGLAFQSGNSIKPRPQPTFMETLQPQLDEPVFVCNFKMDGSGFLEFGRVDDALFTGPLASISADNATKYPGSWSSEGVTYVSNGKALGTFDIVFDTGGPGTSGPLDVVRAYHAQVAGSRDEHGDGSQFTVPCDAKMPDLEFRFANGATGAIPGKNMLQPPLGQSGRCQTWFNRENSPTRGLVGDAFFNSNVVVFNQRDATISWAPQK